MAANDAAAEAAPTSTPCLSPPRRTCIERDLAVRPDKTAYIDEQGSYSFRRPCAARKPLRQCSTPAWGWPTRAA